MGHNVNKFAFLAISGAFGGPLHRIQGNKSFGAGAPHHREDICTIRK